MPQPRFVVPAFLALFATVVLAAPGARAQDCAAPIGLADVLAAYGAGAFGEIDRLDFTFHVAPEGREIVRRWSWRPATGEVTRWTTSEGGVEVAYLFRHPLGPEAGDEAREADRAFLNDRYWLLFPHRLGEDTGVTVEVACEQAPLPFGDGQGWHFTARYAPDSGGYTPGDAYELWVGDDHRVLEWAFHRGGSEEAALTVRFADHQRVGPLVLSLARPGADGQNFVWFTDVAVETAAGRFTPEPL